MPHDLLPAVTAVVAYIGMLSGHGIGDHWIQTSEQACKKALDSDETTGCSMRHCAKHVASWTAVTTAFVLAACWWLRLPLEPGWVAAGMTVNATTHFVADLRTPLVWLATRLGRGGYVDFVQVVRPARADQYGPGTAVFHLDQSWHKAWMLPAALLTAGPFWT